METSATQVDKRCRKLRRKAVSAGEDLPVPFRLLLDMLVEVFGRELAELREENRILEGKLDSHISTLRTDVSHVRQGIESIRGAENDQ